MNRRGAVAIGEILIMVVGIFAVAWAIGEVSGIHDGEERYTYAGGAAKYAFLEEGLERVARGEAPATTKTPTAKSTKYSGFEEALDKIAPEKGRDTSEKQGPIRVGSGGTIASSSAKTISVQTEKGLDVGVIGKDERLILKQNDIITVKEGKTYAMKEGKEVEIDFKPDNELIKKRIISSEDSLFWSDSKGYYSVQGKGDIVEYKSYKEYSIAESKAKNEGKGPKFREDGGWFGKGTHSGALASAAGWAITAASVAGLITGFLSGDAKAYGEALTPALGAGVFAGKWVYEAFGEKGILENTWAGKGMSAHGGTGIWSIGIGAAMTAIVFVLLYSEEETETITFTCSPWDAPSGGNDCELCNNNKDLPCSEYQCRSLGQSCELQNADTDTPLCSWTNRKDVIPPKITLWEDVLTPGLKFAPLGAASPKDRGNTIVSADGGCIPAYTPLSIGIQTDEPAKCKVDVSSKDNFSDMSYYFGDSLYAYNHTLIMTVPGQTEDSEGKIQLKNDGIVQLYVRCQDPNENVNDGNFVFKFCVDPSEDTTAPQIIGTNIINEMPVAYGTENIAIELYTNEPADCRWDALDKGNYEDMKNTMNCNRNANERNAQMVYTCKANLNGIKSGTGNVNNFYFKCRDKPTASSGRNTNAQSYKLTLYGTEPLILDKVGPDETTIKDNTDPVWVELTAKTSAGYRDGDSSCYYKLPTDREYIKFLNTGSSTHSQRLTFESGKYNVSIKCVDAGGNSAEKAATFRVEVDRSPPEVQRIYKDAGNLRTVTDEEAECVYDTLSCSYQFNDGIAMTTVEKTSQFTEWKEDQTYYIKCRDKYGNQPDAGSCTIEAHMYERL